MVDYSKFTQLVKELDAQEAGERGASRSPAEASSFPSFLLDQMHVCNRARVSDGDLAILQPISDDCSTRVDTLLESMRKMHVGSSKLIFEVDWLIRLGISASTLHCVEKMVFLFSGGPNGPPTQDSVSDRIIPMLLELDVDDYRALFSFMNRLVPSVEASTPAPPPLLESVTTTTPCETRPAQAAQAKAAQAHDEEEDTPVELPTQTVGSLPLDLLLNFTNVKHEQKNVTQAPLLPGLPEPPKRKTDGDVTDCLDGGVMKRTIIEPCTAPLISKGKRVTMHVVLRLGDVSGEPLSFTPVDGAPLSFIVGTGEVVRGLDLAALNMRRGEVAHFTFQPEYAFGEEGVPNYVPGNAVLHAVCDLRSMYPEPDQAGEAEKVKAALSRVEEEECKVREVLSGKRNPAEIDHLRPSPETYFTTPEQAASAAAVQEAKSPHPLNDEQSSILRRADIILAERFKREGNVAFKEAKWEAAVHKYAECIACFEQSQSGQVTDPKLADQVRDIGISAHLNHAAAQLKLFEYGDAIASCRKVILLDSSNVKALYRAGQAAVGWGDYELAQQVLRSAQAFCTAEGNESASSQRAVSKLLQEVVRKLKFYRQKEKTMFGSNFAFE